MSRRAPRSMDFDMMLVYDGHTVRVTGRVTPGQPEQGPTYSCGGQPAEPPEIEDLCVYAEDGTEMEVDDEIFESMQDEILEHVSQNEADDMNDAAERRNDMERED